jgi:hypothetical protein
MSAGEILDAFPDLELYLRPGWCSKPASAFGPSNGGSGGWLHLAMSVRCPPPRGPYAAGSDAAASLSES